LALEHGLSLCLFLFFDSIYFSVAFHSTVLLYLARISGTMTKAVLKAVKKKLVKTVSLVTKATKKAKSRSYPIVDGHKECSYCHQSQPVKLFAPDARNSIGLQARCNPCLKIHAQRYRETDDGFLLNMFGNSKGSSKKRVASGRQNLGEHTLTLEDVKHKLQEQNGLCAISGQLMTLRSHSDYKASIERLGNGLNYSNDNFSLVCLEFNTSNQWSMSKYLYAMSQTETLTESQLITTIENARKPETNSGGQKGYKAKKQESRSMDDDSIEYKCNKCNTFQGRDLFNSKISWGCKSCSASKAKNRVETWRGAMLTLYNSAIGNSKKRQKKGRQNMTVDITFDTIVELYKQHQGRCAYSGIIMTCKGDWKISLERIKSWEGYIESNVVLVAQEFNSTDNRTGDDMAGGNWSKEKFMHIKALYLARSERSTELSASGNSNNI
jgi:hypothetical protein